MASDLETEVQAIDSSLLECSAEETALVRPVVPPSRQGPRAQPGADKGVVAGRERTGVPRVGVEGRRGKSPRLPQAWPGSRQVNRGRSRAVSRSRG